MVRLSAIIIIISNNLLIVFIQYRDNVIWRLNIWPIIVVNNIILMRLLQ